MTHPQRLTPPRIDLRLPDAHGWYVYHVGEEMRCPGQKLHKASGLMRRCNKYMGTVAQGVVMIRPEVRLGEGMERRQSMRFRDTCQENHGGCGAKLEIQDGSAQQVA